MSKTQLTEQRTIRATHGREDLARQYGSGVVAFTEQDIDLYERNLLFDHVVAIESAAER